MIDMDAKCGSSAGVMGMLEEMCRSFLGVVGVVVVVVVVELVFPEEEEAEVLA